MFKSRRVLLDQIFEELDCSQFASVLSALHSGQIESFGYSINLVVGTDCSRIGNRKQTITKEEWESCSLHSNAQKGLHLVDSQNCQALTEITLTSSQVNRLLGFTSQSGGEQPKMGPKLIAYLAAKFAYEDFDPSMCPEDLFTELEERPDIWDNRGPISQNRGIAAMREVLEQLDHLDQQLRNGIAMNDISFASGD